jgi:hypothetical protein
MSPPMNISAVGQKVWLKIDPSHIIPILEDQHG